MTYAYQRRMPFIVRSASFKPFLHLHMYIILWLVTGYGSKKENHWTVKLPTVTVCYNLSKQGISVIPGEKY